MHSSNYVYLLMIVTLVLHLIIILNSSFVVYTHSKCFPRDLCHCLLHPRAAAPNLFGTRDQFRGTQFFYRLEGRAGCFQSDSRHYIYCALHFYYYYVVIYNEIIIQVTIMQSQWDSWGCFPAIRRSHLGVVGVSDWKVWPVFVQSTL